MIRIQKLKQPKESSGTKVITGQTFGMQGIEIKNNNKFDIYVDTYARKKSKTVVKVKKSKVKSKVSKK